MPPERIESRQLRYYVAVAEEASYRRAAERLHIAQPALSRHIKALEGAMGVQLLERSKHHVKPTPAGRVALERARVLLKYMDDLVAAARRAAEGEIGTLRIGFISFVAYEYLPRMLRAFRAQFPDVGIELQEFMVMQQFEMLLDDRIDVAILRPLYKDPRIATRTIARSRFVVALPGDHPCLKKRLVRMADLAGNDALSARDAE